jgi:hypothetical protein
MSMSPGTRRCPVCGQPLAACGDGYRGHPVDIAPTREERPVAELKRYTVTVNRHQTEMMLDATDAAAYGDAAVPVEQPAGDAKARRAVPNKTRTVVNKSGA